MEHEQVPCSLQLIVQEQEQNQANRKGRRGTGHSINNFIQKTFDILQQKKFESIVSWCEQQRGGGCSFKIHKIKAFEQVVLPQYFKHSNMSSFVRQLNMYNFHKVRGDKNDFEFEHELFVKNRPDLLHEIKRKQIESSVSIPSLALITHTDHYNQEQAEKREDGQCENVQGMQSGKKDRLKGEVNNIYKKPVVSASHMFTQSPQKYQNEQNQLKDQRQLSIARPSSNQQQDLNKLAELQQVNRNLKKAKQAKLSIVKQLILNNRANIASKFNKTVMAIISSKLQKDLNTQKTAINEEPRYSMNNLHLIVDHIMDNSNYKSFKEYMTMVYPLFEGIQSTKAAQ